MAASIRRLDFVALLSDYIKLNSVQIGAAFLHPGYYFRLNNLNLEPIQILRNVTLNSVINFVSNISTVCSQQIEVKFDSAI